LTLAFLLMALNVAIPVLGEALHWYHLVAFDIVAPGILTSVRGHNNAELPIGKS
jgi:hypothetical protein